MELDVTARHHDDELSPADAEASFAMLVATHHADLVRLAYAIVGDADTAHDVAQAAWTSAWRNRGRLRERDKVRGWLLTIAANEARRVLRRRRLRQVLRMGEDRAASVAPDRAAAIDLVQALQSLAPRDREMLARRYALGQTSDEIGQQLGMTGSGVRVRIGRLLAALREVLQ